MELTANPAVRLELEKAEEKAEVVRALGIAKTKNEHQAKRLVVHEESTSYRQSGRS